MCITLCLTGLRGNLPERSAKNQDGVVIVILVHEGPRSRKYKLTDTNSSDADYNLTTMLQLSWGKGLSGLSSFFFRTYLKFKFAPCPCSEVHKAIQKSTGKVVALKRILMHNEKEGMPVTALREIKILKALKHDCVVNILDMFVVRSKLVNSFSLRY